MRKAIVAWAVLAFVLAALAIGSASDRDEAILTVQVTSADHEVAEGYFTLGQTATIIAKPESELYKFLVRHRGRKVKVVLTPDEAAELSRLKR